MIRSPIAGFKLIFCLALILSTLPERSWAKTDTLDVASILEYLSEGNAEALVSHADPYLELALLEQPRRYTHSQALYVLQKFFRHYSPDGFELDHSMSHGQEWWLIGHYMVSNDGQQDKGLRIYLRFGKARLSYKLIAIQVIRS